MIRLPIDIGADSFQVKTDLGERLIPFRGLIL